MECCISVTSRTWSIHHLLLIFSLWITIFLEAVILHIESEPDCQTPKKVVLSDPHAPIGLFDPIAISPATISSIPSDIEPLSPLYPTFPSTYEPILTGKCPVNFSTIANIIEKTASDCAGPLAPLVGHAICCPQVSSLMQIFQGSYSLETDSLVLPNATANDCFLDIFSILSSKGAYKGIPTLCSVKPSNLTGESCPVKDLDTFGKLVNMNKLLEACSNVDPLKECCRPACQSAVVDAAILLSSSGPNLVSNPFLGNDSGGRNVLSDCKGLVHAWIARKLSSDDANTAFRILSSCKVNKECPLKFKEPTYVINACKSLMFPNPSCCKFLNAYMVETQKQMLITNRQAINCATILGSILQSGGVTSNIYGLCDVDLKDFSLQAHGQQGCLLRSPPSDIIKDNITGFSFTCDLNDNIEAPWPASSISAMTLCAPEMSLAALPAQTSGSTGLTPGVRTSVPFLWAFSFSILL